MKSLMPLYHVLLDELGSMLSTCTLRDWETITKRVEEEGDSFLTITLAGFCDDFQKSLDDGYVDSTSFLSFRKAKGSRLPAFLRGFVSQVFNSETGVLLDEPNPDAIRAVRQLTLFYSKINIPCSDARNRKAIDQYVECERFIQQTDSRLGDIDYRRFNRVFDLLFGRALDRCEEAVLHLVSGGGRSYDRLKPKHGPGATADRLMGNQKWKNRTWTERLEKILPAGEMLLPSWRSADLLYELDEFEPGTNGYASVEEQIRFLTAEEEQPVRVILVPKTLKTPRIIAIEPTAMQYSQQALASMLVEEIGLSHYSPMIGFDDQEPNQFMAAEGSLTGQLATLDLSSASDLVSNQLVINMLARYPHFSEAVQACRSLNADVPDYGVMPLAKFASMGSALTFPIEAMVFLTLTVMGVCDASRIPVASIDRSDIDRLLRSVRVYGDDIICPTDSVHEVISCLETYGFKVGLRKSFWNGSFRESCGKEYYAGHDVSIVKCRRKLPSSLRDVEECVSYVSLRNHLYKAGLWATALYLDEEISRLFKGRYPTVSFTSPVLGRHSFLGFSEERMHATLHAPQVKGYVEQSPLPKNPLDGEAALLKFLLKRGDEPYDVKHLERSGRPDAVYLKLRWASPF